MGNKYLPIGSIVNVNGIGKKIMIVGYYSLEFNNSVKMYDYVGVAYPEGMLLKNSYSFNHSDIISVDFMGYPAEEYQRLNSSLLLQQITTGEEELQSQQNFVNLKFDENGVVVYEEISPIKQKPEIAKSSAVDNPFEVKTQAASTGSKPKFSFNADGVVTEEIPSEEAESDIAKIESNFKFGFDANGVVTEEIDLNQNEAPAEAQVEEKPVYKFDANGFIVGEDSNQESEEAPVEEPKPVYSFDENGVITGDGTNSTADVTPSYHFGEDGITITG